MIVKLRLQIPSFKQVVLDSNGKDLGTPSKSYHVYVLEVASNCSDEFSSHSRVHRVEKRYSQFLGLHMEVGQDSVLRIRGHNPILRQY